MTGIQSQDTRINQSPEVTSVPDHLGKLVNSVISHARAGAVASLMVLANGISSPAQAQTAPRVVGAGQESTRILERGELPKPVLVTPGGTHTDQGPKYTVTSSVSSSPKTADGREFSKLTEAEVDALSDPEYDKYQKWKIAQKTAANNQKQEAGRQLDTANNQKQETNNQMLDDLLTNFDERMNTFANLQKLYAGGRLSKNEINTYISLKTQLQAILQSGKPEKIYQRLRSNPRYISIVNA